MDSVQAIRRQSGGCTWRQRLRTGQAQLLAAVGFLLLCLSGCAVRPPLVDVSAAEYERARARFASLALDEWTQRQVRLQTVAARLFEGAATQCAQVVPQQPLLIQHFDALPNRLRSELRDAGLARSFPRVFVLPAADGSRGALSVRTIDGQPVVAMEQRTLDDSLRAATLRLSVARPDGSAAEVTTSPAVRCDVRLTMSNAASIGASYSFGTITMHTGTVDVLNDDQLAFVLGHELGHRELGHMRERNIRTLLGAAADAAIGLPGVLTVTGFAVGSQSFERAADHFGLRAVALAGFDTAAAVEVWERVATKLPQSIGPHWLLRTHPRMADRDADLRQLKGELAAQAGASAEHTALQRP
jgi:hypothetical protein